MCGDQRFAELVHTGGSAERTGFGARKTAIILFRASFGQLFISCSIQSQFLEISAIQQSNKKANI